MALLRLMVYLLFWSDGLNRLTIDSLSAGYNSPLRSDQWLQDMIMLEQNVRAELQVGLSMYATGAPGLDPMVTVPLLSNPKET
jgi:hypothetical protein